MYSTFNDRFLGYKFALEESGFSYDESLVYQNEFTYEEVFELPLNFMRNPNWFTRFFTSTEHIAFAVMDKEHSIPSDNLNDVSIIDRCPLLCGKVIRYNYSGMEDLHIKRR